MELKVAEEKLNVRHYLKKTAIPRIAVICQNDNLWSLYAWNNVFKEQKISDFNFIGLWNCEEKFAHIKKKDTWKWYLKTFGAWNFLKLALFAGVFKISLILKSISGGYHNSFKDLCRANNINYLGVSDPNSPEFIDWVKKHEVDILIVMSGHILKKDILMAPKMCSVNKHAGLLPTNRGVFPYFWAQLKGETQGISFHIMNEKIDDGKLIYQEKVQDTRLTRSMISFYYYSHKNYGEMLIKALRNLQNKTPVDALTNKTSYHSLPATKDYKKFCHAGGKIISWSDLFLSLKFRQ